MGNDFLSNLLKAIRLSCPKGSTDRNIADRTSSARNVGRIISLRNQKAHLEDLYSQYQIEQTKYPYIDYSKTIESIKHDIDLHDRAINDLIIEIEKDEQIIRENDEQRRKESDNPPATNGF